MFKYKYTKKEEDLFKVISSLKTVRQTADFLRDLNTAEEIKEMADRWQIVKMIDKGMTYREIAKKKNISTTTVSRVARWLTQGTGGYQKMLKKHYHNSNSLKASSKT